MARPAPLPWTSRWILPLALVLVPGMLTPTAAPAVPEGQLTWAVHVSLAPGWFDPAETTEIITPHLRRLASIHWISCSSWPRGT